MQGELTAIDVARRPLDDCAEAAGEAALERVREAARPLAGARVLHLAAAGAAARPAELLGSLLPLMRGLGIDVEWRVLSGGPAFASVARQLDNGLRGGETAIAAADWDAYVEAWAGVDAAGFDALVAHDPGGLGAARAEAARRIWCCHLDASRPDGPAWERARPLAEGFDACSAALRALAPPGLDGVSECRPGLDPLAARNRELPITVAGAALRFLGVDLSRPFCCQVGALDPWRDPHETIDAFRLARTEAPELQLVLAGPAPREDAGGWRIPGEVADYAGDTDDLLVLTGYVGVGEHELNALQRLARVAVQLSVRDDFGLGASEALWKGTPVIAAPTPGALEQVRDGQEGFLAEGAEQVAARLVELVRDPAAAIAMGRSGRVRVRERFLVTRMLEDELRLLHATLAA